MMGKKFDEVVFKLKPGQVSEIFETERGYHFVLVRDRREARKADFEKVKPQIKKFLIQEERAKLIDQLVERLEKEEKINYLRDFSKKGEASASKTKPHKQGDR
jgi:parvulin-like peptidyl-prolyl isomerase